MLRYKTMKQIIQNYRTGELELAEVPVPLCSSNKILIRNVSSLISLGTERSIIELGKKSLLGKARARPDLAKRFMEKSRKEGLLKTFKEALGRLDNPTALGYSSAGMIVEVGRNVHKFSPGDMVACIGAGYASHAEYITVPENLCCRIPDGLSCEEASFGMLGIIALHGIRSAKLTFGESVGVIGLGLLGLLTVQILKAYGAKVAGMDIDPKKVALAQKLGIDYAYSSEDDFKNIIEKHTEGHGADAVIITAATKSDAPVNIAVDIARFGGKVVMVGVGDIHPQRNEMWHKEVELIVSKAGGAGSLDPIYENKGIDYPVGYVRWTENRNLQEFLRLVSNKELNIDSLITHRFLIDDAMKAYDGFSNNKGEYIGVILNYPDTKGRAEKDNTMNIALRPKSRAKDSAINIAAIGAGLFGRSVLLPILIKTSNINLRTMATSSSGNTYHFAKKYGFEKCTTDYHEVLEDKEVDAVFIITPHSLHAQMVSEFLMAGKDVFVEKPLCVNEEQLSKIIEVYSEVSARASEMPLLSVGYNRRFSPHAKKISDFFASRNDPMMIHYCVNAGFVPADHWVHDEEEGGGRIVGEMCHFIDIMQMLTGSNPVRVFAERISGNNATSVNNDNVAISIKFMDGSVGNIVYSGNGDRSYSREQIEIFCEKKTVVSTDYRKTSFYSEGKKSTYKTSSQDMGYQDEFKHFFEAISGKKKYSVNPEELFYSTAALFSIHKSLSTGTSVTVQLP